MQKRTREILAVLLLGLLLLAGVGAMGYYIFIGHNWNVAASNIDDSIGQMDGYTVILYKGTMPPKPETSKVIPNAVKLTSESASAASDSPADSDAAPDPGLSAAPEAAPEPEVASGDGIASEAGVSLQLEAAPDPGVASEPEAAPGSEAAPEPEAMPGSPVDPEVSPGQESSSAALELGESSKAVSNQDVVVDMDSAVASYCDKGATVFVLDASDLHRYSEPFVVAKNGMRIGLLSVGKSTLRSAARADAHYLSERDANYIIAVTNDVSLGKVAADGLIGDVSIIVCDDPEDEFPDGRYFGSTYCVNTPYVGEIGAIIVSPSGVLSTKTMDGRQDS